MEPAYRAYGFTDSIGVNTNLSSPATAYYNVDEADRDAYAVGGASAASRVQSLLAGLGIKHIRYDFCDPKPSPNCARGNATARRLHTNLGIGVLDAYFGSGGQDPAKLATSSTIVKEIDASLAVAADPANAPAIEAFEGTNEPDNKPVEDWPAKVAYAQSVAATRLGASGRYAKLGDRALLPSALASPSAAPQLASWAGDATYPRWTSTSLDAASQHAYFYTACPEAGIGGTDIVRRGAVSCASAAPRTTCKGGSPIWLRCSEQLVGATKPIWITETGYTTSLDTLAGMSEQTAAIYLPRLLLEGWRRNKPSGRGFARTYLFELLDSRQGRSCSFLLCTTDRDAGHGLVASNYRPKAQYTALKNLFAIMRDPGGASAGSTAQPTNVTVSPADQNTVRRLLFRRSDGRYVLALWRPVSVWRPATTAPPYYLVQRGSAISEGTAPNTTVRATVRLPTAVPVTVFRPSTSGDAVETQPAAVSHTITVHSDVTLLTFR